MDKNDKRKNYGREQLKQHFRDGTIPTQNHFSDLIDSIVNIQDDGFNKTEKDGFMVSNGSQKLLTFYKNSGEQDPLFFIEKSDSPPGLKFIPYDPQIEYNDEQQNTSKNNYFLFDENGNLGIGTESNKNYKLEVNGFASMQGRIGCLQPLVADDGDKLVADAKWHDITGDLDGCNAFEIVASTGKNGTGKYAMVHAIALSTFGHSRSRIRKTSAYYRYFWHKLCLRWKSDSVHKYRLQIRTRSFYGDDVPIHVSITKLWIDPLKRDG